MAVIGLLAWGFHALACAQDKAPTPAAAPAPAPSSAPAQTPAPAAERNAAPAKSAGMNISDLASAEKRARELEIQGKVSSLTPAPMGPSVHRAAPSAPKSRPLLWSLVGTNHRYLAEVVFDKQLLVIQSGQDEVPGLGRLEWMDASGVYIRPPKRHKLPNAWLNSVGMLVLPAPRDGQDQPVVVDLPSPASAGLSMLTGNTGASPVPLVLPQGVPGLSITGPATFVPTAAPTVAPIATPSPAATATVNTSQIPPHVLERARALGQALPGAEKNEPKGK